ncbi:MAG TPA: heavy metal-associated domain-containing protein [Candidatus Peribacterales bacterium]|nr:heavy metal-associated domain-containing protein [Candidatus Peribacterales bacterium]
MQTTFSIPGMHCASCASLIKDVSSEFSEVTDTNVDLERKIVTLIHEDDFDIDQWKASIEELGSEYSVHSPSAS